MIHSTSWKNNWNWRCHNPIEAGASFYNHNPHEGGQNKWKGHNPYHQHHGKACGMGVVITQLKVGLVFKSSLNGWVE